MRKICMLVREKCTTQVPVCITRPVHFTKTVEVRRLAPKRFATTTATRHVPKVM